MLVFKVAVTGTVLDWFELARLSTAYFPDYIYICLDVVLILLSLCLWLQL